jgi:hypothetical protein
MSVANKRTNSFFASFYAPYCSTKIVVKRSKSSRVSFLIHPRLRSREALHEKSHFATARLGGQNEEKVSRDIFLQVG